MLNLQGTPIVNGIISGTALKKPELGTHVTKKDCLPDNIAHEVQQYFSVLSDLQHEFKQMINSPAGELIGKQIIEMYIVLLKDPLFSTKIPNLITKNQIHAQQAVIEVINDLEKEFTQLTNEFFRARFIDFKSLSNRIIERLNSDTPDQLTEPTILIANNLSPAELLHIPTKNLIGLVLQGGSPSSHVAILVESLCIPTIFGVKDILDHIETDMELIVDGYQGTVIINPNKEIYYYYQILNNKYIDHYNIIQAMSHTRQTIDGIDISVLANIGNSDDIKQADTNHADGIGLLRTEIFHIAQENFRDEISSIDFYKNIFSHMKDKPITIRTLDIGGDKLFIDQEQLYHEINPYLGYRSTRMFLDKPNILRQQISAIIKSTEFKKDLSIMFPFITILEDFLQLKEIFLQCWHEIKGKNTPVTMPIGMMAEIPSTILCIEDFLSHVDFISIGTNDLAQYILAADRNNPSVSHYYRQGHPAVLKMIHHAVKQCNENKTPISICGDLAKEKLFTRLLLGIGVTKLSMSAGYIPLIRYIVTHSSVKECAHLWTTVSTMSNYKDVHQFLSHDLDNFLRSHNGIVEQIEQEKQ